MAFDKEEIQQLKTMFDDQRSAIMGDTRTVLEAQLRPIKEEITLIKERLDRLGETEAEDTHVAFKEIDGLKKKIKKLELRITALEG